MDDRDGIQAPELVYLKPSGSQYLDLLLRKNIGEMEGLSVDCYPAYSSLTEVHPGLRIIRTDAIVGIRMTLQGLRGFVGDPDPDEGDIHKFRSGLGDLSENMVHVERGRNEPVQAC